MGAPISPCAVRHNPSPYVDAAVDKGVKLFKMDVVRGRKAREAIAHAETVEAAKAKVASRYPGWKISNVVEIPGACYFIIAEWEPE